MASVHHIIDDNLDNKTFRPAKGIAYKLVFDQCAKNIASSTASIDNLSLLFPLDLIQNK